MSSVLSELARHAVVPVIAIESAEAALPLADALIAGGLPVAEITFRTEAAAEVIRIMSSERPDLIIGAGTVLTEENVAAAHEAGARFAVAPGTNPAVVKRAAEVGLPFVPGVATPTDIELALSLGCRTLKLFPAGALGGPDMVKALAAPYRHTGVRFVPTGGVKPDNLAEYLAMQDVAAVGGTWLAKKDDIARGDWEAVSQRCREACAVRDDARKA